jgi:Fe-S-cluster-containing hydrogenase component 2/CRP-like cAMP-binding protein
MGVIKNPTADLVGDVPLSDKVMAQLSLFSQLKRKVSLDKFPGYSVVRKFSKGDVICRQGEPGWTAFYILSPEDTMTVLQSQLDHTNNRHERAKIDAELADYRQRAEKRKSSPEDTEAKHMSTVYLAISRSAKKKAGILRIINARGRSIAGPLKNFDEKTFYMPVDGTMTQNYDSLRSPLLEGELFGEMSCMYRTPRSATVVARRDCYMLEMLRNILDAIQKDPGWKKQADDVFRRRFLDMGMRKLSIFADLPEDEFEKVRESVDLVSYEPGQVICEEFDRADALYIIRSGLVKAMKNVSSLLAGDEITDWDALAAALRAGEAAATTPVGKVWALLTEPIRTVLRRAPTGSQLALSDRMDVILGLNAIIKTQALADAKEFAALIGADPLKTRGKQLLDERAELKKKKKDWTDPDTRRFGRMLLEAVFPQALKRARQTASECILNYHTAGEYIGENGVLNNQPHNVTCVAYGHPNEEGQVQVIKVPADKFRALADKLPALKEKVKAVAAQRRKHALERLLTPVWDDTNQVQLSGNFEGLGLIQGQKLMLIDLDRCTRCDECVQACVNTHDDGRTRLFLDGPRFGKFLVPISCRSCLDPVCMIPCPVSSIHRGDNRQIVIEDWCIGCGLCAESCPYGSIQMHDQGVITERSRGWEFTTASAATPFKWMTQASGAGTWLPGVAPFYLDRDMRDHLGVLQGNRWAADEPVLFRYPFTLTAADLSTEGRTSHERKQIERLKLIVTSHGAEVTVWIDGQQLADCKPKQGRREYELPVSVPAEGSKPPFLMQRGSHILAVRVKAPVPLGKELMMAGLYAERRPDLPEGAAPAEIAEEVTEKLVTQRAVVCDLCSTLPGQSPACVRACPHDAAIRVNARQEFPQQ